VPRDERGESGFIAMAHELVEQLAGGEADSRYRVKKHSQMMTCASVMRIGRGSGARLLPEFGM
jgi:hypothetical protein